MRIANDPGSRREFLKAILTATAARGLLGPRSLRAAADEMFPPVRQITRGPRYHWFGYYDKLQFDPAGRYVLGMEVDFEHRSPRPDDVIEVGMVDLHDGDRWIELGETAPGAGSRAACSSGFPARRLEVIWNDRRKDRFVSHIMDVRTGDKHTLPAPIYALVPNGKEAVSCDFSRVADCRPGYGYAGIRDRFFDDMAPEGSGVTHVNLETGVEKLIVSHKTLATTGEVVSNHPARSITPITCSSARTESLHSPPSLDAARRRSFTRLITANMDGSDLRIVIPNGYASHFIWRDATHILSQAKGWLDNNDWGDFLFEDKGQRGRHGDRPQSARQRAGTSPTCTTTNGS